MNRRHFIRRVGLAAAAGASSPGLVNRLDASNSKSKPSESAAANLRRLGSERPARAEVRDERGGPRLFVNGRETYPLLALSTHLYPTIDNFREAGIRLYHPLIGLRSGWKGPGDYDWTLIETFFGELLNRDPDAYFLPRIQLNTPDWWKEGHPEACILYGRKGPARNFNIVKNRNLELSEGGHYLMSGPELWEASFASERWLQDTETALRAFVRHIEESPLRSRILGYHTTTGSTGEWNYFGANFLPDYSEAMQEACGPAPSAADRIETTTGLLRDPAREKRVIRWYQDFHDTIADAVLRFPKATKEETDGRVLCGVYYGYILEQVRIQDGGYLATRKVFDSPHLDYIAGPYAYQPGNVTDESGVKSSMVDGGGNRYGSARGVAGDGGYRMLIESLNRRGKLFICEMDPSSYLDVSPHEVYGGHGGIGSDTLEGTLRILRRDLGQMFVRGAGGWLYDFGPLNQAPNGWYASAPIIEEMRRFVELGARRVSLNLGSVSEIAVFCDEKTFTATQHWEAERPWTNYGIRYSDFFNHWFLNTQSRAIHRIGAPADFLHQWDLDANCPDRYRLILMLNTFLLSDDDRDRILARLEGSGATVVWFYAPGYIGLEGLDLTAMEQLTGFSFEVLEKPGPMMIRTETTRPEVPPELEFGVAADRSPRFRVTDGYDEVYGRWIDSDAIAFAAGNHRGFRSIYVGTAPLPIQVLRRLAEVSGVHLWSNRPDIVYASRDAAMVVATQEGVSELHWPSFMEPVEGGAPSNRHTCDLKFGDVRIFTRPPKTESKPDIPAG